jgi:hypothetical protein
LSKKLACGNFVTLFCQVDERGNARASRLHGVPNTGHSLSHFEAIVKLKVLGSTFSAPWRQLIRRHAQVFLMTLEDIAQQYCDPLTQTQGLVLRCQCTILFRECTQFCPASVTIDPIRTLTLVINPSFNAEIICNIALY